MKHTKAIGAGGSLSADNAPKGEYCPWHNLPLSRQDGTGKIVCGACKMEAKDGTPIMFR